MKNERKEADNRYQDILNLSHHVSVKHPQMSMHDRAAQFAPFAALTGHEAAVREKARLTQEKPELSEDEKELLDEKLSMIIHLKKPVSITHFVEDRMKEGGACLKMTGTVKKMDPIQGILVMEDGEVIETGNILDIEMIEQ